ncbi:hypothetical protein DPM13_09540 [Paracoccus mutanolyticus]|uniref:Uncharacterized protein n=1 Tax=Paracoccus mutanolyticus TaxID=1499308 RepID=A0ABN5M614_9RHOB|nr:hypothetical protein DPM13_09540 [Paracoccus mutanolyticus]
MTAASCTTNCIAPVSWCHDPLGYRHGRDPAAAIEGNPGFPDHRRPRHRHCRARRRGRARPSGTRRCCQTKSALQLCFGARSC